MNLTDPIFHDDNAARAHLESIRWADGVYCPHCGNADQSRLHKLEGKSHRPGLWQCNVCREHFTVTVGSVMERSKIALSKWVLGFHLYASSKKGMSAHQLHRMLGVTYKTAWFMAHRIREAMKEDVKSAGPMGGSGKVVEADETYFGPKDDQTRKPAKGYVPSKKPRRNGAIKRTVMALVERGGSVRSFHVEQANVATVKEVLFRNVDRKSTLYTDQAKFYIQPGRDFEDHRSVNHSADEYVRYEDDATVHTNTIENVFSVFKRGMIGTYQHCGEAHLHRYLAEFDFRYNRRAALGIGDWQRAAELIEGAAGKRLTYQQTGEAADQVSAN